MKEWFPVNVQIKDSATGRIIKASFYVAPDYLCVGTDDDWARVNITPRAAQKIADSIQCFLPTRKMVNDIYKAAKVKLEPVPMYAFRDSTPTMYHHHLIVEGQRKQKKGLIGGIKKGRRNHSKAFQGTRTRRNIWMAPPERYSHSTLILGAFLVVGGLQSGCPVGVS